VDLHRSPRRQVAGRLRGWTQRASARQATASPPDNGDPAWADFARRTAELAALLAS
jgi:hypothetical protein